MKNHTKLQEILQEREQEKGKFLQFKPMVQTTKIDHFLGPTFFEVFSEFLSQKIPKNKREQVQKKMEKIEKTGVLTSNRESE